MLTMVVHDAGKVAFFLIVAIGAVVMTVTRAASFEQVTPLLTVVIGYVAGNGTAAVRRNAPSPMLVSPLGENQAVTVSGPTAAKVKTDDEIPGVWHTADQSDDAWPDPERHPFFAQGEPDAPAG